MQAPPRAPGLCAPQDAPQGAWDGPPGALATLAKGREDQWSSAPSSVSASCPFAPGAILSSGKSLDRALGDGPPCPSSILGLQSLLYICVLAALRHFPLLCPLTPAPFSHVNSRHCFLQEALHNPRLSTPYGRRPTSGKQQHPPSTSCAPEAAGLGSCPCLVAGRQGPRPCSRRTPSRYTPNPVPFSSQRRTQSVGE